MSPSPLLGRLRASWQNSTCTITRTTGTTWDGSEYVPSTTEVYSGVCHVRPTAAQTRVVQAGEQAVSLRTYLVEVPADTSVKIDDDVTVDTSDDPEASGLSLRVLDVPKNDLVTVRVLECQEQT